MTNNLIDQLRERRDAARTEADEILARASGDLEGADAQRFTALTGQLDTLNNRLDEMTAEELQRANQTAVLERAAGGPAGGRTYRGPLTGDAEDTARAFRAAIHSRNPAPIEVFSARLGDEWPDDVAPVSTRAGKVRVHQSPMLTRDITSGTPTQALGVDVYGQVVSHLLETSAILSAGSTVITTDTGEPLEIPKSTSFGSAALTPEGTPIAESDPVLDVVTLKSYKFASFFQVSHELANDSPTDLLTWLATAAAEALAQSFGPYLINGDGQDKPLGLLRTVVAGVLGSDGTDTGLGSQGTPGQGTDLLWDLVGSVSEPYTQTPAAGFLLRNVTDVAIRKLKDLNGQPITGLADRSNLLGYRVTHDGFMPVAAPTTQSIVFGDFSRGYFARIVNGIRFERSDEFAFQEDLVSFKAVIRLDGAQVDVNALKAFVNGPAAANGARSK